jgi:hypothetical protein
MLVGIIFSTYINIKKSEWEIGTQQIIIQESNNFLERLHELSLDYSIDYEEYFNRYHEGCGTAQNIWFSWNQTWSCTTFTKYGNNSNRNCLYYCDSSTTNWYNSLSWWYTVYPLNPIWSSCVGSIKNQCFWEYKFQFRDITDWYLNNGNDAFVWEWPIAIAKNTWVQELYLINKDWDHRVYFRRKLLTGIDLNWDWLSTGKNESLYTIQTLKLKWFDAGIWNNFNTWYWWVYDWFIDTRACDAEAGFACSW